MQKERLVGGLVGVMGKAVIIAHALCALPSCLKFFSGLYRACVTRQYVLLRRRDMGSAVPAEGAAAHELAVGGSAQLPLQRQQFVR